MGPPAPAYPHVQGQPFTPFQYGAPPLRSLPQYQTPAGAIYASQHPYGRPNTHTNGLAIAAMCTCLLGLIPIVLGSFALWRIKRNGDSGRGLAIAGIIVGVFSSLVIATSVLMNTVFQDDLDDTYGDNAALDQLWDACAAGDAVACDDLFDRSGYDTGYEEFGYTCGDRFRNPQGDYCVDLMDEDSSEPATDPAITT